MPTPVSGTALAVPTRSLGDFEELSVCPWGHAREYRARTAGTGGGACGATGQRPLKRDEHPYDANRSKPFDAEPRFTGLGWFHAIVRSRISLFTISGEMNAGRTVAYMGRPALKSIIRGERIHLVLPTTEKWKG